jgi:hypothetical protein
MESAEYVHLLWPMWGASHWHDRYPDLFGEFLKRGMDFFTLTEDPASADYFLPPCGWQKGGSNQAFRMAELAERYRRPLVLFFNNDSDEPIPVDDAVIFRTSMNASTAKPNEHAWPAWTCDVLRTYGGGRLQQRLKAERPTVSYCGYVDYRTTFERVQRTIRGRIAPWARLRGEAVRALSRQREIDCRFVLRRGFGGHAGAVEREEYARNLLECDYAIVVRGQGNFSFRLYEAMSAGVIPVFIDTDCRLPFDDVIPYRQLFVWVPASDVSSIADHVAQFHAAHDADSLYAHRRRIRQIYERYLEPLAFHRELALRMAGRAMHGFTESG